MESSPSVCQYPQAERNRDRERPKQTWQKHREIERREAQRETRLRETGRQRVSGIERPRERDRETEAKRTRQRQRNRDTQGEKRDSKRLKTES